MKLFKSFAVVLLLSPLVFAVLHGLVQILIYSCVTKDNRYFFEYIVPLASVVLVVYGIKKNYIKNSPSSSHVILLFVGILGFLIITTSEDSSRNLTTDETIRQNIRGIELLSERYFTEKGSYAGMCGDETVVLFQEILIEAQQAYSNDCYGFIPRLFLKTKENETYVSCESSEDEFMVKVLLPEDKGYWCAAEYNEGTFACEL